MVGENLVFLGRGQDEDGVVGRLLEGLQKCVEGRRREHVHLVDDEDLVLPDLRRYAHLVDEDADVVDRVVRCGVELDDVVGTLFVEGAARLTFVAGFARLGGVEAVDCLGKDAGTRGLAYAAGTAEEVGMSQLFRVDGVFEGLSKCFLTYHRPEGRGPVFPCRNNIVVHIVF